METDELRALLAQVRHVLDPREQNKLLIAEKSWEAYRDSTCDIDSTIYFDGGSGHATEAATCLYIETSLHLKDLHAIYDWEIRPH